MDDDEDVDGNEGSIPDAMAEKRACNNDGTNDVYHRTLAVLLSETEVAKLVTMRDELLEMMQILADASGVQEHEISLRMLADSLRHAADRLLERNPVDFPISHMLH